MVEKFLVFPRCIFTILIIIHMNSTAVFVLVTNSLEIPHASAFLPSFLLSRANGFKNAFYNRIAEMWIKLSRSQSFQSSIF